MTGPSIHNKGFTLLEILVAVTIMGLAYVAILQNFSMSSRNIFRMENSREAMTAAALDFDQSLLDIEGDDQDAGAGLEEQLIAEGNRYRLLEMTDDQDLFTTLKLEKK